jgi:hypothetical protein
MNDDMPTRLRRRLDAHHGPLTVREPVRVRAACCLQALHRAVVLHATGVDVAAPQWHCLRLLGDHNPHTLAGQIPPSVLLPASTATWLAPAVLRACWERVTQAEAREALQRLSAHLDHGQAVALARADLERKRGLLWHRVCSYAAEAPTVYRAARWFEEFRVLMDAPADYVWPACERAVTPDVLLAREDVTAARAHLDRVTDHWHRVLVAVDLVRPGPLTTGTPCAKLPSHYGVNE